MTRSPDHFPGRDGADKARLSYSIDLARGMLCQTWRGAISHVDVEDFWNTLIQDPETLRIGRHLNDLRECTLHVSGDDWLDMIVRVLEHMPPHAAWKAAIVVDSPANFGVVRQFLGYAGDLVVAELFTDLASAERWLLDSPPDAAATSR